MNKTKNMTDEEVRRLGWRCRRGLLELDIVLQRFSDKHLVDLSALELSAFDSLLDLPDNEFLDLVTSRIKINSVGALNFKNFDVVAMRSVLTKLSSYDGMNSQRI